MPQLLKDCGLEGCKGIIRHCPECHRATAHFARPDGEAICGRCGATTTDHANHDTWYHGLLAQTVGGATIRTAAVN